MKRILITLAVIILILAIINTAINMYASSVAEKELQTFISENGVPENAFQYGDVYFSVLFSTITFNDITINLDEYIGENLGEIEFDELEITFDRDTFPESNAMKSGIEDIEIQDLTTNIVGFSLRNDELAIRIDEGSFTFDGSIDGVNDTISLRELAISVENLFFAGDEVFDGESSVISIGDFSLKFDGGEVAIDLEDLSENPSMLTSLSELEFSLQADDITLPSEVISDIELSNFGIDEITAEALKLSMNKNQDRAKFAFEFDSKSVGSTEMEIGMDFSKSTDDPMVDANIILDNLNQNIYALLLFLDLEKKGDKGFRFEYNGKLSEMTDALQ